MSIPVIESLALTLNRARTAARRRCGCAGESGGLALCAADPDSGGQVCLFALYYRAEPFSDPALRMVADHPDEYNRIVPIRYLEKDVFMSKRC